MVYRNKYFFSSVEKVKGLAVASRRASQIRPFPSAYRQSAKKQPHHRGAGPDPGGLLKFPPERWAGSSASTQGSTLHSLPLLPSVSTQSLVLFLRTRLTDLLVFSYNKTFRWRGELRSPLRFAARPHKRADTHHIPPTAWGGIVSLENIQAAFA